MSVQRNSRIHHGLVLVAACVMSPGLCPGADWATYAHDNQRSYVTEESLKPPLSLQWVYDPPAPPAAGWSLPVNGYGARKTKSNVSYDDSHPAILAGDAVYLSSSAENCVYALEAATGKIRWKFLTAAAPRLAPTYWENKLYFGADDGRVYCLNSRDGAVVWTLNAAPTAETMLGYGRFSSVWPIRTSVTIDENVAYFTAGLFPSEGVYLYAVDPHDGNILWRKEVGQLDASTSLAPQGYLLTTGDSVFVTSRVAPTRFRKSDGRHIPFATPFPVRPKSHEYRFYNGGDYAQIWDGRHIVYGRACLLAYDPDEEWVNRYKRTERGTLQFQWFNARQTVLHDGIAYFAMDDYLLAIDQERLPAVSEKEVREFEDLYKRYRVADRLEAMDEYERIVAEHGEEHPQAKTLKQTTLRYSQPMWEKWLEASPRLYQNLGSQCRWMLPLHASESLILAGDVLYAGGENGVTAIDANQGELLWQDSTGSRVRGLAVANGRLTVSTIDGKVRCYAQNPPAGDTAQVQLSVAEPLFEEDPLPAELRVLVNELLADHTFPRGYALIVGGDGQLAYELAKRTGLSIQVLVDDRADLHNLRSRLAATGLYGNRITVRTGDPKSLPFSPYLFNLVVDAGSFRNEASKTPLSEQYRVTRPQGGIVVTACDPSEPAWETVFDEYRRAGAQVSWNG